MILEPYSPWLVWLLPLFSSIFVPLASKVGSKFRDIYVVGVGMFTLIFSASLISMVYSGRSVSLKVIWVPRLNIELGVLLDPLSVLFANIVSFIGLVVLVYSLSYMAHEEGLTRYYFFMLLFIGSMIGLVIANNLLQLFIFWELVGLCSYGLVSFWHKRPEAVKAGIKVFLMTKIGDVALLMGILLLYANLYSFSYEQLFNRYGEIAVPTLTVISLLMLFGSIVKSAQLPLHTWLYSAMEAPTSVSCLLHGATMVKGGVYLIARTHMVFSSIPLWLDLTAWIGAVTAFVGATLALQTSDIKGVPAYSTISQIGFMIAAFGAASSPKALGWFAGLFHMVSHAFFQGLGFLAIGSIIHQLGTRDMKRMGGLRSNMPITFILSIIVILSRSGIPPFSSFFSKGLIASSLVSTGNLSLILLIYSAAAITFAYSYRFLVLTFLGEKSSYLRRFKVHEAPLLMCISAGVLAAGCIIFGFFSVPFMRFLGVEFKFDPSLFFGFESLGFVGSLIVGGIPIYLTYQRRSIRIEELKSKYLLFMNDMLRNGYYFDWIYGRVANGFFNLSSLLRSSIEIKVLERLPYVVADNAMRLARFTLLNFDVTLTRLTHLIAEATAYHGLKIRRIHSGALPHFVLAAALGFLLLFILLILTT